jgi:ribosome-associated heat shock protein Hsp15
MEQGGRALRLDKFLYFIRFARSRARSVALIEAGPMRIDGRPVTTIREDVRVSQTITLAIEGRIRAIRVLAIPARRGPAPEARACYEDMIVPEPIDAGGR